jgi:hypothetical protein
VFPAGTDVRARRESGRIYAPGISDNGTGLAALVALARAQGFASEEPVSTAEALAKALKRGADIVARGGRYFIDSVVQPGYADSGPDQRAGSGKKS